MCVYVDVEGHEVGGYPDTLIINQSQVENDELCECPGLCAGFGHSEGIKNDITSEKPSVVSLINISLG
ncbi:hypothetical protein LR48_Vigan02g201900 [Vigna angularis]|uniref:Uncharacterized protein n=1 Tax=Phaseolus angularis TaxID=3914 RepID=A0A0L9U0C7_PHAAN|nr:hypothetical protein LR48_Vigan02g201900 [Vigna angularis]